MRASPCTPTDFTVAGRTAKYCQSSLWRFAASISSRTIWSARRRSDRRRGVISPRMRTASPGPGNGCRQTSGEGIPNISPTRRTSSLKRSRSGSISVKRMRFGIPPTLWWVLMTRAALGSWPCADSMTSGYRVPWTRKEGRGWIARASFSKRRINSLPIIFRFRSGLMTPLRCLRKCRAAETVRRGMWRTDWSACSTSSRSPSRKSPLSTKTAVSCFPMARCTISVATVESTPPDTAEMTAWPPTCSLISLIFCATKSASFHPAEHSHTSNRKCASISFPRGVWLTSGWNWMPKMGLVRWRMAA